MHTEHPARIIGIVNLTRDSFSDGGSCLDPQAALDHARQLLADGADIIDLGAESTHPDAEEVRPDEEIARLLPVVESLKAEGACLSVDTYRPDVMRAVLEQGVEFINDVTALSDPQAVAVLRDSDAGIILMHSTAARARAERRETDPAGVVTRIIDFFERRVGLLEAAGIARERLIIDPGMGFFLGRDPEPSLVVLRNLDRLVRLGTPICVSTSRKSFIGSVLGDGDQPRPVTERGAGTLATELWAAMRGVQYIRTHDVRALRDALTLWQAIAQPTETES